MYGEYMLSTSDNPYDPFTQFDQWYAFDEQQGYHTCQYLARIARTSHELSENEYDIEVQRAINEIVNENLLGIYIKVKRKN